MKIRWKQTNEINLARAKNTSAKRTGTIHIPKTDNVSTNNRPQEEAPPQMKQEIDRP